MARSGQGGDDLSVKFGARELRLSKIGRVAAAFVETPEPVRTRLGRQLAREVSGEVRFDIGSRALYATDASNYRQVPLGVVLPRSAEDIVTTLRICHEAGAPVLMRGGGTSLAGETCNVAVLLDCSRHLDRIRSIDPQKRLAVVEPGCILDRLRTAAERHHLTFGPDPSTHDHNTLGGMIGNNSCGVHSVMAGRTSDNVEALEIATYDGLRIEAGPTDEATYARILQAGGRVAEIYRALEAFRGRYGDLIRARYPRIPRLVSGYENLDALLPEQGFNVGRALVGTEGTCVAVLSATLKLVPSPPARVLVIVGFADIVAAAAAVPRALEFRPIGLESIDDLLVEYVRSAPAYADEVRKLPEGKGWLVAEFGGETEAEAKAAGARYRDACLADGRSATLIPDKAAQHGIWKLREAALGATAHVPGKPETWPGWEDSAVPREALADYLRDLRALFARYGYEASVYGHFGDGLVHCRVPFDLSTEAGLAHWTAFLDEAADLVVRYGGSLSGEHGDGQARAALLEKMYGPELLRAFREFKAIWDPAGRMNPGKVVDPYPITSNLRVGPGYRPAPVSQFFAYAEDDRSFVKATRRCVGIGSCRRTDSEKGVMCPSYMVTREEKHSTRGRARLLFEMLHGGAIKDGWKSRAVEEALDLCLACKGCKSDCPVSVDMATYKAEFRAHHYAHRRRPRAAYSMGLVHRWAQAASHAPWLANLLTQTPAIDRVAKWAAGIAQPRRVPRLSTSFVGEFRRRPRSHRSGRRVLLWPDTFTNHFRPATAEAATRVLETLGYDVVVPSAPVCCGRPLYDWGWIEPAKALWRQTLRLLAEEIDAGTPVVGLEPACVSAFRDELPNLFPDDQRALRLSRNTTFPDRVSRSRAGADPASRNGPHSAGSASLPPSCGARSGRGAARARSRRSRLRGTGLRLLRHGGFVRVRAGKVRSVAGRRGARAAAAGARGFEGDAAAGERLQLPRADRAKHRPFYLARGRAPRRSLARLARNRRWRCASKTMP